MSAMTSQITGNSIVCATIDSDYQEIKHQSSTLQQAFSEPIRRWTLDFSHEGLVKPIVFPVHGVIMHIYTWLKMHLNHFSLSVYARNMALR